MTHVLLMAGIAALLGQADDPPRLTFERPVDYIAWYNTFVSRGKTRNAFDAYAGMYGTGDTDKRGIQEPAGKAKEQFDAVSGTIWEPAANPELVQYLSAQAGSIRIMKKAALMHDFWHPCPPDARSLIAMTLPELQAFRRGTKAILVLAWMKQDGQKQALFDAWQTVLRCGGHSQQASITISQLVGIANRATVYANIRRALATGVLKDSDSSGVIALMRDADPGAPNAARAMQLECASLLSELAYLCPGGTIDRRRWKELWDSIGALDSNGGSKQKSKMPPEFDPRAAADFIHAHFRQCADAVRDPTRRECSHRMDALGKKVSAFNNLFVRIMIPSLSRACVLGVSTEADRRATLLVLEMHAYHSKHGRWPSRLDDMALPDLATLRIDPFAEADFHYAVEGDTPTLYSIGRDEKDDGGRHDPRWGEGKDGGDFVFWPDRTSAGT